MRLKIYFTNDQTKYKVSFKMRRLVRKAVRGALLFEDFPYDATVSVTFCDNENIRALNSEYRSKDTATDVLSFPMYDFINGDTPTDGDCAELGDIVISLERAAEQAESFGHSIKREVAFLTVHSVLHLLGYDHEVSKEDEKNMFTRQNKIMEKIKITRDK